MEEGENWKLTYVERNRKRRIEVQRFFQKSLLFVELLCAVRLSCIITMNGYPNKLITSRFPKNPSRTSSIEIDGAVAYLTI